MFVIVDERTVVAGGYASSFDREGISSAGIDPAEFRDWIGKVSETDILAIEAFLIGDCLERESYPRLIRERSKAPVIILNERQSLDQTLELFCRRRRTTFCASPFTCARFLPVWERSIAATRAKPITR